MKKKRYFLIIVLVVIALAMIVLNSYRIPVIKDAYEKVVVGSFKEKYGIGAKVIDASDNGTMGRRTVILNTDDHLLIECECDFLGNIKADSYANIVNARKDIAMTEEIVCNYYNESRVVFNFVMTTEKDDEDLERLLVDNAVGTDKDSYDDFTRDYHKYIWLQLPEGSDLSTVDDLIDDLNESFSEKKNYSFLIKCYPHDVYDAYDNIDIIAEHTDLEGGYSPNYDKIAHLNDITIDYDGFFDAYLIADYNYDGHTGLVK